MKRNFKEAVLNRRTRYDLSNASPLSNDEIKELVEFAVLNVPSAFNSQSARVVILLGDNHRKLWDIALDALRKIVPAEAFGETQGKIDNCFKSGYGTLLFFEEQAVVEHLQASFPTYKDNFPVWSQHTSAMHQFTIWTMLEDAGFGASLQHYNELIAEEVRAEWNLSASWSLIAQMPFGVPVGEPMKKEFSPLETRVLRFE